MVDHEHLRSGKTLEKWLQKGVEKKISLAANVRVNPNGWPIFSGATPKLKMIKAFEKNHLFKVNSE